MADTIPAPLKGKVALVTGGSRGIGAGIVKAFARNGCTHIAITYAKNKTAAEETLQAVNHTNSSIKTCAIQGDVRDVEFGKKVVAESLRGLGVEHLDIVVSNAALLSLEHWGPVADLNFEQWNEMMTSEAWTPLAVSREAFKIMPNDGRMILISSAASKSSQGDPGIAYAAAKAALDAISRNLAAIYAKKNITVNSISVGATLTGSLQAAFDAVPGFEQMAVEASLLKRVGNVDDIANIVAFVASPQAGWITGNAVPANGGALSAAQS